MKMKITMTVVYFFCISQVDEDAISLSEGLVMIDFNNEERWYRVQERDIEVAMQRITSTELS